MAPYDLQVTFDNPNIFYTHKGEGVTEEGNFIIDLSIGWWTMVYNLGFLAKTPTFEFFGLFAYDPHAGTAAHQECISHCDQVAVSWYKDLKTGRLGCFTGEKISLFEESNSTIFASDTLFTAEEGKDFANQAKDLKYEDLSFLVNKINSQTYNLYKYHIAREGGLQS